MFQVVEEKRRCPNCVNAANAVVIDAEEADRENNAPHSAAAFLT
jgi:hypothetical protein